MADEKVSVCIMFPNNSTSVFLGQSVTSELSNLAYFIPEGFIEQAAYTTVNEVKLASVGLDCKVVKINSVDLMEEFDYVIFPSLNVNPRKSSTEFSVMCGNLFK